MLLTAEPLLVARLTEKLPGVAVLSAADLAGVTQARQVTPAVHVLWAGYRPGAMGGVDAELTQELTENWLIAVACRNLRSPKTGEHARSEAAPLVAAVIEALLGWQPTALHRALHLAAAPGPRFEAGFGTYPLLFTTRFFVQALEEAEATNPLPHEVWAGLSPDIGTAHEDDYVEVTGV